MYCVHCGQAKIAEEKYCRNCGAKAATYVNSSFDYQTGEARSAFSGYGVLTPATGDLPPEIKKKFNWGAFFLGAIWALFNRVWWLGILLIGLRLTSSLLDRLDFVVTANGSLSPWSFISFTTNVVFLVLSIYSGFVGNRLAWKAGTWKSVEHFQRTQKKWARWGLAVFIISLVVVVIAVIVLVFLFTNMINNVI